MDHSSGAAHTDPSEIEAAIKAALDHNGPALVEIMTDADLV
ncbi:MAG: hypothetical protein P8Q26_15860 [Ascidiaceihabitans sp.]|nr:hypothetical protein [Ascidiaceihabitans sp.]